MKRKLSSLTIALSMLGMFAFTSTNANHCDWDPTNPNTVRGVCIIGGPTAECDPEFPEIEYFNCTKVIIPD